MLLALHFAYGQIDRPPARGRRHRLREQGIDCRRAQWGPQFRHQMERVCPGLDIRTSEAPCFVALIPPTNDWLSNVRNTSLMLRSSTVVHQTMATVTLGRRVVAATSTVWQAR